MKKKIITFEDIKKLKYFFDSMPLPDTHPVTIFQNNIREKEELLIKAVLKQKLAREMTIDEARDVRKVIGAHSFLLDHYTLTYKGYVLGRVEFKYNVWNESGFTITFWPAIISLSSLSSDQPSYHPIG